MPLTPEEQAEYDALVAEESSYSQPQQEVRGFLPRLGRGFANLPGQIVATPSEFIGGVAGMFGRERSPEEEERLKRVQNQFGAPGQAQGLAETGADIIPQAVKELALLAAPQSKLTALGKVMGLGEKAARIAGAVGTGALSGVRQSGAETGIQAGEFGLGQAGAELLPTGTLPKMLLRMAAQGVVPLLGQGVRGNDMLSKEGLLQAAVQAGLQGVQDIPSLSLRKAAPSTEPAYTPRPGLQAELGMEAPTAPRSNAPTRSDVEEDLFDEVFGGQPASTTTSTPSPIPKTMGLRFGAISKEDALRIRGFRPMEGPSPDIYTQPETEGNVFAGVRPRDLYVREMRAPDVESGLRTIEAGEGDVFAGVHLQPELNRPVIAEQESLLSPAMKTRKKLTLKPIQQEMNVSRKRQAKQLLEPIQAKTPEPVVSQNIGPHAPRMQGESIISTAIMTPEGIATGKEWNTKHADIIKESETIKMALAAGMDIDQIDANKGFIIQDADGKQQFVGRKRALEVARKSGQVDESMLYDPEGHGLISEALRDVGKKAEPTLEVVPAKTQTKALEETLGLLKKKEEPSAVISEVEKQRAALTKSLADKQSEWNVAKAVGDMDDAAAIRGEMDVIQKALRKLEPTEPTQADTPKKLKLKKKEPVQNDRLMLPLQAPLRAVIGGAIGYAIGDTEEKRTRNAILLGGGALLGPKAMQLMKPALKKVAEISNRAANKEVRAEGGSGLNLLGKVVRGLETQFNLGRTQQTTLALEKGKGTLSQLGHEVDDTIRANQAEYEAGIKDPASRAVGEEFLASKGQAADIAKLDAAPVPEGYKTALKAQMAAQREAQMKLRGAESDPQKRALYAGTLGDYKSRLYRIDSDPKMWDLDEGLLQKVVDEFQNGPLKGMDRGIIERNLRQGLAERRNGTDPSLNSGGNKIKQTLFDPRMDLTPSQWGFIDQMSRDPRTPPGADKVLQQFFTDKSIDPAGQQFLRALAGNKKLSDVERAMFREMADKQILTQNYRDLLGEIKDPFERQLYTLNKLFGSVAQAETISQIDQMTMPSGLKMAMDAKQWEQALSNPAFKAEAENYLQVPDAPGFGKLAGKYVPRDTLDALKEVGMQMGKFWRVAAKANNWVKEVATAWNPTVHVRQAIQSPIFLMAAQVGPWDIGNSLKGLSIALRGGDDAIMRELRQQHITEANYGHQELRSWADKIAFGKTKSLLGKAREKITGIYGIPDDFVRITAYLKHKERYLKEAAAKGIPNPDQWARDMATIFVNDHTMNYGQVAKGIKFLRNIPGVSPFASYSAEILRLTKNLARDVATGENRDKIWGLASLGAFYALPVALSQWARSKYLTPQQQETWDDTEKLMPVSDRSNLKIPLGVNKQGSFKFINLNPLQPAGDFVSLARNAARGDWSAVANQQPFFGFQKSPAVSAIIDTAITGEHGFTHDLLDEPSEKVGRVAEAVLPSWVPGGFFANRVGKSLTFNDDGTRGQIDPRTGSEYSPRTLTGSLLGATERVANPMMLQRSAYYEQKKLLDDAQREMMRVTRSGAPQSQKDKAIKKFELKRDKIVRKMQLLNE